jgi:hypothetical protein
MPREQVKTIDQIEEELEKKKVEPKVDKRTLPKELVAVQEPTGLYVVEQTGGGAVPEELRGRFTNIRFAQAAIENHKATAQK